MALLESFSYEYTPTLSRPNQKKDIKVLLTLARQTTIWLSDRVNWRLLETNTRDQKGGMCFRFNRDQLDTDLDFANLKEKIADTIDIWYLSDDLRESVAIQILSDMVQIVESERDMPKLTISCKVILLESRAIYVEEIGPSMVPASDHSIESLQTTIMAANEDGSCASCTICLEDLPVGYEALCMPCSHVFHGECIVEWLYTSHLCPYCRHAMPTN